MRTKKKQQGIALLMMVVVFVLALSSYYLLSVSIIDIKVDKVIQTGSALKRAKQALLAYAVTYSDVKIPGEHGFLPCPDYNNGLDEGLEDNGNCGARGVSKLGYLPWSSLDVPPLKGATGNCLFYAVTGEYKNDQSALPTFRSLMLNEDTYGTFDIVREDNSILIGGSPGERVVAIVIAPSELLSYQNRAPSSDSYCGEEYLNFAGYLDTVGTVDNSALTGNVDDIDKFVQAVAGSEAVYNDRFLTITREEIWQAVMSRNNFTQKMENLTNALAMCLTAYANQDTNKSRRLPWPAKIDLSPADYRDEDSYVDDDTISGGYSGRYPFNVGNSNDVIDAAVMTDDKFMNVIGLCDALDIFGDASVIVDLKTDGAEYRELWNNWKDHFFYLLSKRYKPDDTGEADCSAVNDCIKISPSNTKYAAAVIFSGNRLDGQSHSDKTILDDYLEDGKSPVFLFESALKPGNRTYAYTDPQTDTENDIMYCIEDVVTTISGTEFVQTIPPIPPLARDKLTVVECS